MSKKGVKSSNLLVATIDRSKLPAQRSVDVDELANVPRDQRFSEDSETELQEHSRKIFASN